MNPIATEIIDVIYENRDSTIARDIKLNLKRLLVESQLTPEEALSTLLATAVSVGDEKLATFARRELQARNLAPDQIQEVAESAAIMGMLNTYYRFKHMVAKNDDYRAAGLRMTSLAKPLIGKERFEMLAFAVSVLNGCENCIKAHEAVLREAGLSADKIHDLARMAAVVRAAKTLSTV